MSVDKFIKNGRIGPALLRAYNREKNTSFTLDQCSFSAQKGRGGYAEVVLELPHDRWSNEVGKLYTWLGHDITEHESNFFRELNIGWR